jgi:hypothetical protein
MRHSLCQYSESSDVFTAELNRVTSTVLIMHVISSRYCVHRHCACRVLTYYYAVPECTDAHNYAWLLRPSFTALLTDAANGCPLVAHFVCCSSCAAARSCKNTVLFGRC